MLSRISIILFVLGIAAMGTFGFGLMGHAAQHMCPAIEFLGYECPQQAEQGGVAGSIAHHLSSFQTLSKVTAQPSAYALLAFLFLILAITATVVFITDFKVHYFSVLREILRDREESVFISRRQFFRWFALHTNRDSYAF